MQFAAARLLYTKVRTSTICRPPTHATTSTMLTLLSFVSLATFAVANAPCNSSETRHVKFSTGSDDIQTLNATSSIIVLDYGHEVEGIPSFEVLNHQGDTSLFEISYAESLTSFSQYMVRVH
jgi:hypothetical protein